MKSEFVNSIHMKFVRIEPGSFRMGQADGDPDEKPVHEVIIEKSFWMGITEVTNAEYECFDPSHRAYRGLRGFSKETDEAVVFVSWHDAMNFCAWLSKKEGKAYRLPTEAEWEYACRAGTATPYFTGQILPDRFHKNQVNTPQPMPVSLRTGTSDPNPWGLYDMHGNVEEWCLDWYGPYLTEKQTDPVGPSMGLFKITRGGSHNTPVEFLRSANRLGTLPEDKHWLIGFRVALAPIPKTKPSSVQTVPLWARDVSQQRYDWSKRPDPHMPFFEEPLSFVRKPENPDAVPFHAHNHCPSITWCPNGDLLAVWFSTKSEKGRELTILASRLRAGNNQWDLPSEFFKAPDRNMTGSALFHDGKGTLYHFNSMETAGTWANLALAMRTSGNNGIHWKTRLIQPDHRAGNQVISGAFLTKEGLLVQPCDSLYGSDGGTVLHISPDDGKTWQNPDMTNCEAKFALGKQGNTIAGIHAAVAQLSDGRLLAFGRWGNRIGYLHEGEFRMPMSVSSDLGKSWSYSASEFPAINGGQRPVLMRLREGPLFFASFTDNSRDLKKGVPKGLILQDESRKEHVFYGLFAALSYDDGASWPVKRLITSGGPAKEFDGAAWTGRFVMDYNHAEPKGYLAATQTPDGRIHLISSALHYRFNLAWLQERP